MNDSSALLVAAGKNLIYTCYYLKQKTKKLYVIELDKQNWRIQIKCVRQFLFILPSVWIFFPLSRFFDKIGLRLSCLLAITDFFDKKKPRGVHTDRNFVTNYLQVAIYLVLVVD